MARSSPPQLAKLTRPRLHRVLMRERLFARLDAARTHSAGVCVIGPPGAGKTSLVASWLQARQIPGIWYQIDAGDADLATFFHYLMRACGPARKGQGQLPAFTPEFAVDTSGFARRFFRLLFERMPAGSALVLDNYQEVPATSAFHAVIAEALREVPPGAQLIVISRGDPPECYARLIANRQVLVLDWDELRLSQDEAHAIARAHPGSRIEDVGTLHERCQGWAAGLILMLERGRHRAGAPDTGSETSLEALFDYFASEIFGVLSTDAQTVLMRAAPFPAVTPSLARAASEVESAGEVLEDIHRRRLFVDQRQGPEVRYQFHPLFREFLLGRLRATLPPAAHRALLAGAAGLLEQAGEEAEAAVGLYLEAQEFPRAARLIRTLAAALIGQGRWLTLAQWIESLPPAFAATDAWLLYWQGMARLQQDIPRARQALIASSAAFRDGDDAVGQMLAAAAVIRSYHFEYNTFEPMDPWVEEIDRLLAGGPAFPSPAIELAVHSAVLLAITYRLPGHRLRLSVPTRVRALLDETLDTNQRVGGAIPLVIYYTLAHDFDAGIPLIAELSSVVGHDNVAALNRVYWWLFVGYFWHRLGQRQRADDALSLSARIAEEHGLRQTYFISGCFRSYHYSSWGDVKRAAAALEGLEGMLDDRKPMLAAQYHNASFFLEAWRGNLHAAEAHANLAITAARRLGAPFFLVAWQSQTSTALAMSGAYDLCEARLEDAWQVSEGSFLETYRPMMLATRMFMAFQRGRRDEGQQVLRHLLQIAPDERALSYLRGVPRVRETFVCEGLRAGMCVPLIQSLVRAWEVAPPAPDVPDWPWRVRIHTLGGFRVEVEGEPLTFSGKTPRKPIALLKAIVAFGGRDVSGRRLIDALWADEEGDKAADALAVGLHRLRKLLGNADAVTFQDGVVSLDPAQCWVDAWSLQYLLREGPDAIDVDLACALYAGAFLPQDMDAPWAALMRERLRGGFLRFLLEAGRAFEASGQIESAVGVYARGIDVDDLAEDLYQGQMRCLDRLERRAEALSVFRRLRQALSVTLGIAPSAATQRLFREIQQKAQSVSDR